MRVDLSCLCRTAWCTACCVQQVHNKWSWSLIGLAVRREINYILSGLAVSDGLTMLAYIPFAMLFYVLYGVELSVQRNRLAARIHLKLLPASDVRSLLHMCVIL